MKKWTKFQELSDKLILKYSSSVSNHRGRLRAYLIAVLIQASLFFISVNLEGESEALFSLIYLVTAILIALFLGAKPGHLAGLMAALSVDYHYIKPIGSVLNSWESFMFLAISIIMVQISISGLRVLQDCVASSLRAKKIAEDAVRARENILSIVAHDLRQPLSTIGIKADLVAQYAEGDLKSSQAKFLAGIKGDVSRIDKMIGDLLMLAQIDSNQLKVEIRPTDLSAIAAHIVSDFQITHQHKVIKLKADPSLMVKGDADRLKQVLVNLISNAIKYGTEGEDINIDILNGAGMSEVIITNHGPEIPKEQGATLFKRFVRTEGARASRTAGLGLGLFITKTLVEAHNGRIWAECHDGLVCFHFSIPLAVK